MRIGPFAGALLALAMVWPLAATAQLLTPAPPDARPADEQAQFVYRSAERGEQSIAGVVNWISRDGEGGAVVEGDVTLPAIKTQMTIVIGPDAAGDFVFDIEASRTGGLPVDLMGLHDVALGTFDDLQALDVALRPSTVGPGHWQLAMTDGLRQTDVDKLLAAPELHFIFDTADGDIAVLNVTTGNSGDFVFNVAAIGWARENVNDGLSHYGAFVIDPRWPHIGFLSGTIVASDDASFAQALGDYPDLSLILLDSDGGDGGAALKIADSINSLGIDTVIPNNATCASACATLFLAGHQRVVLGTLGVHRFSHFFESEAEDTAANIATISDDLKAMVDFDVPMPVILAGLQTPHDLIRSFARQEAEAIGINRGSLEAMRGFDPALLDLPLFHSGATLFRVPTSGDPDRYAGEVTWTSTPFETPIAAQARVTFPDRDLIITVTFRSVDLDPQGIEAVDVSIQGIEAATVDSVYRVGVGSLTLSGTVALPGTFSLLGDNRYRVTLDPAFRQRYLELLTRSQIAIPFVLADGTTDIVVIDTGYDGAAVIDNVIANLPPAPVPATEPQSAIFTFEGGDTYRGTIVWDDAVDGAPRGATVFFPLLDFWARIAFDAHGALTLAASGTREGGPNVVDIVAVDGRANAEMAATPIAGAARNPDENIVAFTFARPGQAAETLAASGWLDLGLSLRDGQRATLSLETGPPGAALIGGLAGVWGAP